MTEPKMPTSFTGFTKPQKSPWGTFDTKDSRNLPKHFEDRADFSSLRASELPAPLLSISFDYHNDDSWGMEKSLEHGLDRNSVRKESMIASEGLKKSLTDLFGAQKLNLFLDFVEHNFGPGAQVVSLLFMEEVGEYAIDVLVPDAEPDFKKLWHAGGEAAKLSQSLGIPFFLDFRFSDNE